MRFPGRRHLLIAVLAVLALSPVATAQQQPPPQGRDEPATKFERFLLSKGTVRVREYYDVGNLGGRLGSAKFVVARAYTPGQRDYVLACELK